MNVCQAKCCRRGFLVLMNKEEVISIVGDKELEFSKEKILKPSKNGFLLYDLEKKPCKNLKSDLKCGIHKNPNRPRVCGDYPLFIFKDYVMPAEDCSAVKAGLLDHYVKEIEGLGYKKF